MTWQPACVRRLRSRQTPALIEDILYNLVRSSNVSQHICLQLVFIIEHERPDSLTMTYFLNVILLFINTVMSAFKKVYQGQVHLTNCAQTLGTDVLQNHCRYIIHILQYF